VPPIARRIKTAFIGFLTVVLLSGTAFAAEIKFAPSPALTLNPTYPQRGYNDVLAHTIAIGTGPRERLIVQTIRLDLMKDGKVLITRQLTAQDAVASTRALLQQPVEGLRNVQFLDPKGLAGWFGPNVKFADSADMAPNEALVITESYFAVNAAPDRLRVIVFGVSSRDLPAGRPSKFEATIPVRMYKSPIDYHLPVKGAWLEASLPILQSHHRFIPPNEFAVDFFKVDADGETLHDGTPDATHWYAYGQPVLAAAAGEVVHVTADQVQDRAFLYSRPGETADQRSGRVNKTIEMHAASHFPESIEGNSVVLRHDVGGAVEYSSYAHLKTGSIKVKVGDHVKQGDVLAEVGDTGDTTVVHLHFQVNAGPDQFFSPSLPFHFSGMEHNGSTQDPGWFVQPE
jgi:murein DD-endopeptidase MepM/ murein hydrolase activator NlpD